MSDCPPNLLVVFNRRAEDGVCELFLPYWQRSGCDILCSSPLDQPSQLAGVAHYHAGRALTIHGSEMWFLQSRVFDTMKYCLTLPYEGFLFTQYDSICLGKLPCIGLDDCVQNLAGGPQPGFNAPYILHPPWCYGKNRLKEFIEAASLYPITIERGFMDMWLGFIMDQHKIAFTHADWSWTTNSIETLELQASANKAIKNGCLHVHGVKNKEQLDAILAP